MVQPVLPKQHLFSVNKVKFILHLSCSHILPRVKDVRAKKYKFIMFVFILLFSKPMLSMCVSVCGMYVCGVYMCEHVCIWMCTCMSVCGVYMCEYVCAWYIHVCGVFMCMCHGFMCMCVCCVFMCVCICVCMFVCVSVCDV